MRGLFVTATDTGVGKTVVSAALLAAMAAAGESVRAYKPAVTGLEDPAEIAARGQWPADHELLAAVAGMSPEDVAPLRYGPAASPHLAAELAGERIEPAEVLAGAHAAADSRGADDHASDPTLVVEGVGGLLVPLAVGYAVRDLALELGLPLLVAARPGLGTINHTLLTLEAARAVGVRVAAVVLTPWPPAPTSVERSNRETIARLGEVEVQTLERIPGPETAGLARAGGTLPWRAWLDASS
jgi:dethiobiotin synthetase